MPSRKDPVREISHLVVYAVFYLTPLVLGFGTLMQSLVGTFAGMTLANLGAALFANWLAVKIYHEMRVTAIGLEWNRASADNFALGLLGGIGAASAVLAPALLAGAAHIVRTPAEQPTLGAGVFFAVFLLVGRRPKRSSSADSVFRHCSALSAPSPASRSVRFYRPTAIGNPNATWLGIANTVGFGADFRLRLPAQPRSLAADRVAFRLELHVADVRGAASGLTMKVTGYDMSWTAGALWSGGAYGPEASVLAPRFWFCCSFMFGKRPRGGNLRH